MSQDSQECVRVKEEVDWEGSLSWAPETELYAEHEVKEELVLGPERLQAPDVSFMLQVNKGEENACTKAESTTECEVLAPNFCFVNFDCQPISTEPESITSRNKQSVPGKIQSLNEIHQDQQMKSLYVCEFCDKRFQYNREVKKHEVLHVLKVLRSNNAYVASRFGYINHKQNVNEGEIYNCNICMTQFSQKADLSNHMQIHKEPFKSDDNLEHFTELKQPDRKDMRGSCKYTNLPKTEEVSNFCISCSTEIRSTLGDFANHLIDHIKEDPELKLLVKEHVLKDSQRLNVSCNICLKQFKSKDSLRRHEKIHRGNVTCDMCKKQFTNKKSLIKHFMYCTGENFYFCNICNKKISRKQDFDKHLLFHTGENRCKCNKCGKVFMHPASLKRHAYVHKDEYGFIHTQNTTHNTQVQATVTEKEKSAYIPVERTNSSNSKRANNQCVNEELDSNESIQSANFQESTLFNRLKLLKKTLHSNHMGKSNTNFP